jgi:transketolase
VASLEPDTQPAAKPNPALAAQAAILARPATEERRMADALRALAIDAVEAAKSGHPGMPMGMADAATALWTRFLKFDAADPRWPDRDRFVLSAGHGSMLLYGLLHLTGHAGMGVEELKRFRQLHSPAAGHPEYGEHPGIETTTGPLGQGLATAVGMAMAERLLAARFGDGLVDHRTWVVASDGDLMEGISHEAASLAGHLRLGKLTVLYDDNNISIDGRHVPLPVGRRAPALRGLWLGGAARGRARRRGGLGRPVLGAGERPPRPHRLPHHHRLRGA